MSLPFFSHVWTYLSTISAHLSNNQPEVDIEKKGIDSREIYNLPSLQSPTFTNFVSLYQVPIPKITTQEEIHLFLKANFSSLGIEPRPIDNAKQMVPSFLGLSWDCSVFFINESKKPELWIHSEVLHLRGLL